MKYGLRTIGDLDRIPGGATIAAPPEFRTRFEGLVGLRERYMLRAKVVAMPIGQQYKALDEGRVDAPAVAEGVGGQQTRSHQQRLSHGGVPDRVGVGLRPEVAQIQLGHRGEVSEAIGEGGLGQPG
jgi:hypothetical protein